MEEIDNAIVLIDGVAAATFSDVDEEDLQAIERRMILQYGLKAGTYDTDSDVLIAAVYDREPEPSSISWTDSDGREIVIEHGPMVEIDEDRRG